MLDFMIKLPVFSNRLWGMLKSIQPHHAMSACYHSMTIRQRTSCILPLDHYSSMNNCLPCSLAASFVDPKQPTSINFEFDLVHTTIVLQIVTSLVVTSNSLQAFFYHYN